MTDQPNKEQMKQMLVPAAAVAVVILLVGLLLYFRNNPDTTAPGNGKSPNARDIPGQAGTAAPVDTEGLSPDKPPEGGPEWKDVGGGLKVWDVKEGTGAPAQAGGTVTIHYTGWTLAGKMFDSSVYDPVTLEPKKGDAVTFSLDRLIQGWQKGIPGQKPGGIRRLYIPWPMAYGEAGSGKSIPPRADLIFEIKLFDAK